MKPHHHTFLLTLAVSVTLLVAAVYSYMYWAVGVSVSRVAAARDIVALEKAGKEHEQEIRALHENTAVNRARLAEYFVPANVVVDFIEVLEALGPQAGSRVVLSAIDANVPEPGAENIFGTVRARIDITGSWSAVMKTLSLAESLPYAVYVSNVRMDLIAPTDTQGREWRLSFAIEAAMMPAAGTSADQ